MAIVGGLDIHRRQITYDWIDTGSGETRRGQLGPATRLELRAWLTRFTGQQADFALEATTGWRFVAEELERAGFRAHLAEPADTRALRGPKYCRMEVRAWWSCGAGPLVVVVESAKKPVEVGLGVAPVERRRRLLVAALEGQQASFDLVQVGEVVGR